MDTRVGKLLLQEHSIYTHSVVVDHSFFFVWRFLLDLHALTVVFLFAMLVLVSWQQCHAHRVVAGKLSIIVVVEVGYFFVSILMLYNLEVKEKSSLQIGRAHV